MTFDTSVPVASDGFRRGFMLISVLSIMLRSGLAVRGIVGFGLAGMSR